MNIGEKIKNKRIEKNLTIEDLALLVNDNVENIEKYENNELEPTLDKKLNLCKHLDLTLDDLSYSISNKYVKDEHKINLTEEIIEPVIVEEEIVERPYAKSSITYNEKVFNLVFKSDFIKYCLQTLISVLGYGVITIYAILMKFNIFAYVAIAITGYSLIKLVVSLFNFKSSKKKWLEQHNNMTREYYYYKEYIEVVNNALEEVSNKISYSSIIRVVEKTDYILCMCLLNVKTILIIDKSTLNDEDIVKVRTTLKEVCPSYIEQSVERKEQHTITKGEKVVKVLNVVSFVMSLCSIVIINIIYRLFKLDDLLEIHLLVYGLSLIIPLFSIFMGIFSKKKYQIKAKKNIVVGIVMATLSLMFILLAFANHTILSKGNNDTLYNNIENVSVINFPDHYYTLYKGSYDDFIIDEIIYKTNSYQIWNFPNSKEVLSFEENIKKNECWRTNNVYTAYFGYTEDAKELLKTLNYDVEEVPTYYLLYNLDNNEIVNKIEEGNYVFAAYYEKNNCMLVINFENI